MLKLTTMKKKIILGLGAVAIVIAGVASFSAWEAHIINVTAHIENALAVSPDALDFGTVFPQEYLFSGPFTVGLSQSFIDQEDAYRVDYVIKQKTKCVCAEQDPGLETLCAPGEYAPIGWDTHQCPDGFEAMLSLCPYLSKMSDDEITVSHPSYFQGDHCYPTVERVYSDPLYYSATGWGGWSCPLGKLAIEGGVYSPEDVHPSLIGPNAIWKPGASINGVEYPNTPWGYVYDEAAGETGFILQNNGMPAPVVLYVDCQDILPDASGILTLGVNNSHSWTVDLKVPPFAGYVGQDWPAGCPVLENADPTGTDMGCDLWIEVTNILRQPQ